MNKVGCLCDGDSKAKAGKDATWWEGCVKKCCNTAPSKN